MKKYLFFFLMLVLLACGQEINAPESKQGEAEKTNISRNGVDTLTLERINFSNSTSSLYGYHDGVFGHVIIDANSIIVKSALKFMIKGASQTFGTFEVDNAKFLISADGELTKVNDLHASEYKGYIIKSDGDSFTPQRVAMWRGELYEDPLDGASGDTYYNLPTNKERIFVKNNWQDRK